jgi:hypothetical protein
MHKKSFTIFFLLLFAVFTASAQLFVSRFSANRFAFKVGTNVGASQLFHDINFRSTPLNDLYEYTRELFAKNGVDYTWEKFMIDNKMRSTFITPRFGFSAMLQHERYPIFWGADVMSSPSGMEHFAYSTTVAMGNEYELIRDRGLYGNFHAGYKFTYDRGFGSSTLVNSVGDASLRDKLSSFFNPTQPLGSKFGHLFSLRVGAGQRIGDAQKISVGFDAFGDIDLTPKYKRKGRMTNVGITAYVRYLIRGARAYEFYPFGN